MGSGEELVDVARIWYGAGRVHKEVLGLVGSCKGLVGVGWGGLVGTGNNLVREMGVQARLVMVG